jgi:hypothetical protein
MVDFDVYADPAAGGGDIDFENNVGHEQDDTEMIMDDEDIPVTQEDAWAVIRYVCFRFTTSFDGNIATYLFYSL